MSALPRLTAGVQIKPHVPSSAGGKTARTSKRGATSSSSRGTANRAVVEAR